jgi:hypothetical protein
MMKRVLAIVLGLCLLSGLSVNADIDTIEGSTIAGGGEWPSFTYDVWEDMEDSEWESAGNWTEVDTGSDLNPRDTDAEYSANDSGTYGTSVALDADDAYVYYSTSDQDLSIGFWVKTPTNVESNTVVIWKWHADAQGDTQIYLYSNGGSPYIRFRGTGWADYQINLSQNTWYWITVDLVVNNTCTLRVYDTNDSIVQNANSEDDTTVVSQNYSFDWIQLGKDACNLTSGEIMFDDLVINLTGTFPLQPGQ